MVKVNETHDHAVYEKIIGTIYYFMFAAERLLFFSDAQNVFRISVCIRVCDEQGKDLCIGGVGAGKDLAWGAHKSTNGVLSGPVKHGLQAILYQAHCKTAPPSFFSFLDSWFFLAVSFYPSRFMWKPLLNHFFQSSSVARLGNATIIGVSSLVHDFSNFFVLRPLF